MQHFILFLVTVLIILFYSQYIEPNWFKIKRVHVKVKKPLPRPIAILHLSDTHFTGKDKLKDKFFDQLCSLDPDFVFITGDIIDCDEGIDEAVRNLARLKARVGKYAILGNHDYWNYRFVHNFTYHVKGQMTSDKPNNTELFIQKMEAAGIRTLVNQNVSTTIEGKKFTIAGTDDPVTTKVDFTKTFENMKNDSFNILLTHLISVTTKMPSVNLDIVFSGHTHGGQFRLPFLGGFVIGFFMHRKYLDGVHEMDNGVIACISRGIGASRSLTLRFFCRPEAILMEISA